MDKTALRSTQNQRDAEVRRLNSEAAKRYLAKRETQASTGLIREILTGVIFFTLATIILVIGLAL